MKIVNTAQLLGINTYAVQHYSEYLPPELLTHEVDPDGLHILNSVLMHESGEQISTRCIATIKLVDRDEPLSVLLDVEPTLYNALLGTKEAIDLQAEFVTNWNATL